MCRPKPGLAHTPIFFGRRPLASRDRTLPAGNRGDIQVNSRKLTLWGSGLHRVFIRGVSDFPQIRERLNVRKTIRILGVSLVLVALLVFATGVVSDWHHDISTNDAQCPYCHLGHQIPIDPETSLCVSVLNPVATVPLPENIVTATGPVYSQIAPRAPPSA
jgi:hypothetical protein